MDGAFIFINDILIVKLAPVLAFTSKPLIYMFCPLMFLVAKAILQPFSQKSEVLL